VRLYGNLGLRTYIEPAKSDIVRVIDSTEALQGPSTILFKRDAEVTYVQTATMRADQALAAAMAAPLASKPGCGCQGGEDVPASIARQSGGRAGGRSLQLGLQPSACSFALSTAARSASSGAISTTPSAGSAASIRRSSSSELSNRADADSSLRMPTAWLFVRVSCAGNRLGLFRQSARR
jgi:hypothetical protein